MTSPVTAGGDHQPTNIGRYQVAAFLGVGGFAAVYRAHDPALDADVAIKVLDTAAAANDEVRARFLTEARLLRRVDNPNVVTVHDIGELPDGRPYFVMEFAKRGALEERMPVRSGAVDAGSLVAIVDALESALTALHEADVVHRDIKPANVLIDGPERSGEATSMRLTMLEQDERLMLGDLGIAKDRARESTGPTIMGGTPYFRAPEQTQLGADVTPATDIYGATAVIWKALTGAMPPAPAELGVQLPSIPGAWRDVMQIGLHSDQAYRFPTAVAWADACRAALDADVANSKTLGFRAADPGSTCPYKGLSAFQPDDAGLFFGRESMIDSLVAGLQVAPALIVGGPSGSGKSSLMRAGLIPAIEAGAMAGSQQWHVALFSPGSDALGELAHRFNRLSNETVTADDLRRDPRAGVRSIPDDVTVLVAVDQFEELFTQTSLDADRAAFIDTLAALGEDRHARHRVVLALRADFYDQCAHYPWLAEQINENHVLVGPLGSAELRQAIEGPAGRVGMQLEAGLVDRILDDAGASRGSLPLVAHALMETWLRRRGHMMTLAGYEAAGGVVGAIAQRAESTYHQLDDAGRDSARRLLLLLTRPGDNGPDTRRRLPHIDVADEPKMQGVIDTFAEARLLTVDDSSIDLAHETLLRSWPRARGWIDEARDDLRFNERLRIAAAEWDQGGRDDELLWAGTRLATALQWAEVQRSGLAIREQAFLDVAQAKRDAREAAEHADARRQRRNRRNALVALSVLTLAAVLASIVAFVGLRDARRNETAATDSRLRALAAAATGQAQSDPLFALALAVESAALQQPAIPEARDAIVTARVALDAQSADPIPVSDPLLVGDALTIAMAPDGRELYVGDRAGPITVWNLETGTVDRELLLHNGGVQELAVSPDGQHLASASDDGTLALWDLSKSTPTMLLGGSEGQPSPEAIIWSVAFSPDGAELAASGESGTVYVFDVASASEMMAPMDDTRVTDGITVAWSGTEHAVLVGTGGGDLFAVDLDRPGADPTMVDAHGSDLWEIVATSDGAVFTVSANGEAKRWVPGAEAETLFSTMGDDAPAAVLGLAVIEATNELVVGGSDGRIRRWDIAASELISTSTAGHGDRVIDGAVSADGSLYASLGDDQQVRLWDLGSRAIPAGETFVIGQPLGVAAATADGTVIAAGAGGSLLAINGRGVVDFEVTATTDGGAITSLAVVGSSVIVGDSNGALIALDPTTGVERARRSGAHDGWVLAVAPLPDGSGFVTAGADGVIRRWETAGLAPAGDIGTAVSQRGTPIEVNDLAVSPDGNEVISVHLDGGIGFWNTTGAEKRPLFNPGNDSLNSVAIAPDGKTFTVAAFKEFATIFTLADAPEALAQLTPVPGGGSRIEYTSDGATLVVLSEKGAVVLFDVASGAVFGPIFRPHNTDGSTGLVIIADVIWSTGAAGTLHRLDVLDLDDACQAVVGIFDERRQDEFLSSEKPVSCVA